MVIHPTMGILIVGVHSVHILFDGFSTISQDGQFTAIYQGSDCGKCEWTTIIADPTNATSTTSGEESSRFSSCRGASSPRNLRPSKCGYNHQCLPHALKMMLPIFKISSKIHRKKSSTRVYHKMGVPPFPMESQFPDQIGKCWGPNLQTHPHWS